MDQQFCCVIFYSGKIWIGFSNIIIPVSINSKGYIYGYTPILGSTLSSIRPKANIITCGTIDTRLDSKSKFESGDITIQGAYIDVNQLWTKGVLFFLHSSLYLIPISMAKQKVCIRNIVINPKLLRMEKCNILGTKIAPIKGRIKQYEYFVW